MKSLIAAVFLCVPAFAADVPVIPVLVPNGDVQPGVHRLAVDPVAYEAAREFGSFRLEGLALGSGQAIVLDLSRVEVFSADAVIVLATAQGEMELPRPDVQVFSGKVKGEPESHVFLAVSPHGTSGYIQRTPGISVISSGPAGTWPTILYDAYGPLGRDVNLSGIVCAGDILPEGEEPSPANTGAEYDDRASVCRGFRLAIDCDTEFLTTLFGDIQQNATAYVTSLVGAMTEIYRRDVNAGFELAYLRLWGDPDPYTGGTTSEQLPQFRSYWQNNMGSVSRNLAHLLSGRSLGGGIAYKPGLCSSNAYGVSANMNGYFPYPIANNHGGNWDLMVVSHEIGHNFNSGHTHDPNSYNPPIDGCGNAYLNPPQTQDCTAANLDIGTIMSYCHVCPGGMSNMRMEFGPRPSTVIRSYIDGRPASCGFLPSITISQQPQSVEACTGQSVTFSVTATGTGARTYRWRKNGIDLFGPSSPTYTIPSVIPFNAGTYECVITAQCASVTTQGAVLTVGGPCPTCDADYDQNGIADQDDISYLITVIAGGANPTGRDPDFDQNGVADQDDVTALINVVAGGACP